MLAMESRTPLGVRCPALSLTTIASMLAPTFTPMRFTTHHVGTDYVDDTFEVNRLSACPDNR